MAFSYCSRLVVGTQRSQLFKNSLRGELICIALQYKNWPTEKVGLSLSVSVQLVLSGAQNSRVFIYLPTTKIWLNAMTDFVNLIYEWFSFD